ncbi:ABC transporter [Mycena filopes]|nr:ABC transporter [Mycena filopes]
MASQASSEHTRSVRSVPQDSEKTVSPAQGPIAEPDTILTGKKLAVVFVALMLSMFITSLDQTILATALPHIASDFNAFSLQGWVSTSFVLAQSVFLLFYGQVIRIFPAKWVLVCAIGIFELGSLVCALSQSIYQLIGGRVVTGVGAAGIMVALIQVVMQATRLEDRPRLFGLFGAVAALSSIIGPLIGGGLTDHNFWLNLPLGGVSMCGVVFLLKAAPPLGSDPAKRTARDRWQQTLRLDLVGLALVSGAVTTLVLGLQWGGNTKPWNDKAVIIASPFHLMVSTTTNNDTIQSFVLAVVLTAAWVAWSIYMGDKAMTPTAIFKPRSMFAVVGYGFLNRFAMFIFAFYIPILYQASRDSSATKSGLNLLPLMLSLVGSLIVSGQVVGKFGYYWPTLVIAPCILAIGSGLLYTITPSTTSATLIGFQILAGMGVGIGMQNSLLAVQVEFKDQKKLLGQAMSMCSFAQFLGATIGLGVAEPIFASELARNLRKFAPDAPLAIVIEDPTAIYTALPKELIAGVVRSYTNTLRVVFVLGVPVAGLALGLAFFIKNERIVKTPPPAAPAEPLLPPATESPSKEIAHAAAIREKLKDPRRNSESEKTKRLDTGSG